MGYGYVWLGLIQPYKVAIMLQLWEMLIMEANHGDAKFLYISLMQTRRAHEEKSQFYPLYKSIKAISIMGRHKDVCHCHKAS